jgi:hypothetical protein
MSSKVFFMCVQVAITNVLLWFCIWTPYAAITMIAQFGNPMLITPVISQLPSFLGTNIVQAESSLAVSETKQNRIPLSLNLKGSNLAYVYTIRFRLVSD